MKLFIAILALVSSFSAVVRAGVLDSLQDGDSVVFLGGSFIEQEEKHGYIEEQLTRAVGGKKVSFRNLGWAADGPKAESRIMFEEEDSNKALDRLLAQITELKPKLLVVCYGTEIAHNKEQMDEFLADYDALINKIKTANEGAGFVILTPPALENLGEPFPDQVEANATLLELCSKIDEMASQKNITVVDLFEKTKGIEFEDKLTVDGVLYKTEGYKMIAPLIAQGLGAEASESSEELIKLITEKNFLYAQHWRPANHTYLLGKRMNDQGHLVPELAAFLKLTNEADQKISEWRN